MHRIRCIENTYFLQVINERGGQEGCGVGSILISMREVMSLFKILPCTMSAAIFILLIRCRQKNAYPEMSGQKSE